MAKKSKKAAKGKGAGKGGGKPAKGAGKKAGAMKKDAPGSKAAGAKASGAKKLLGMHPMSSGSGASPMEIGQAVVAHLNSGAHSDAPVWDKYWSNDVVSIEGMGANLAWHGRKAMEEKCQGWLDENKVHGCRASGPFVGSTGFCVLIEMDVETKKTGERKHFKEVAAYTVQNGKVVREEFMYGG
jgi:hypothetical protein